MTPLELKEKFTNDHRDTNPTVIYSYVPNLSEPGLKKWSFEGYIVCELPDKFGRCIVYAYTPRAARGDWLKNPLAIRILIHHLITASLRERTQIRTACEVMTEGSLLDT